MKITQRKQLVIEVYRPFLVPIVLLLALIVSIQTLMLSAPYFYGRVVDELLGGASFDKLTILAVSLFGVLILKGLLDLLHGYVHIGKLVFDINQHLAQVTLERVLLLSLGQVTNHNSGFKQDVIKKGEVALVDMLEAVVFELIPTVMRVLIALICLAVVSPLLGVIASLAVAGYVLSSNMINKHIKPTVKLHNAIGNRISTLYWEIIKHLQLVMVSNHEKRTVKDYASKTEGYYRSEKKLWNGYVTFVWLLREPFNWIGQFLVLMCGISLVVAGELSAGMLVMALAWSRDIFVVMGSIGSMQRRFIRNTVQIGRYFELLEIAPAIKSVPDALKPEKFNGDIEFQGVCFEYPQFVGLENEARPDKGNERKGQAVNDVSFRIKAGTTCAFVGHSGAGKSTIINLLLRGYDPDKGIITIDGLELKNLDHRHWRAHVGVVTQDNKLWDGTLGYNICYGLNGHASEITESDLLELAERTRITEFFPRLGEKPFETEIGENGIQLSGGQRQRVALARAIARNPAVLILDEATNALDPLTEQEVHQAIKASLRGRTGIIIAHRLSTIRSADQIVVFEQGRVVGVGKHDELLRTCQPYRALVEHEVGTLSA